MNTRNQIDDKYKWDLSVVYKNLEDLNTDYNKILIEIPKLKKYENKLMDNANNLYNMLDESMKISMVLDKMSVYTYLKSHEDLSISENKANIDKILNLSNLFTETTSFFASELLENQEKIEDFYKQNTCLLEYKFYIDQILRYKKHILSKTEERLLSSLNKTFANTDEIFTTLKDVDISFGTFKDENDQDVELNNNNYSLYISSKNRNVRKQVFELLYKTYKNFSNTFSITLKQEIEKNSTYAKIKYYNSAIESSLYDENVSTKVYDTLINTVSNNLDKVYKYYEIKQKMLGLNELHFYDIYVDILKTPDKKYTFDQAQKIVLEALKPLGKEYISNLKQAFSQRWIDVFPSNNKISGAYSSGTYLTYPYVLLNFNGKYDDVSTLAHELGHSMHSYYSKKNNPYQYSEYQILVAEVASTVNELLVANYMLISTNDKSEKLFILNHLLELFKSTIYRQTMFAEFEKQIYAKADKQEALTKNVFNNVYHKLIKKYFGNTVVIDDEINYEWERIPHFYQNFYVYKYATGLSSACYIVSHLLNDEGYLKKYLSFLKSGGSDYPINELKIAGVDLESPLVVQEALNMFEDYLNQFEKLYKELN